MSKELTLNELLTQRCVEFANSERAVEIIDKGIANLFNNVIDDAFRSYGDFGKALRKAMESALPNNIEDMVDLKKYNTLVTEKIRNSWESSGIEMDLQEKVISLVKDFTSDEECPKYIKASDLWEAFIEDNSESAMENQWGSPQVFINDEHDGFIQVGIHPEERSTSRYLSNSVSAYSCDYSFHLSIQRTEGYNSEPLQQDGNNVYELIGGKVNDRILGKKIVKAYSRFDKLVLALYYGGSFLVWDESPEGICYSNGWD